MHNSISLWWRLAQVKGVGRTSLYALREHLGGLAPLAQASTEDLQALGLSHSAVNAINDASSQTTLPARLQALLQWSESSSQHRRSLVSSDCEDYPPALASLHDAPLWLTLQGNRQLLQQPMVAIVGSRNPTPYARDWARHCGYGLAQAGVCVVSGLALGIDAAAHEGALAAGGATIAVLGCGADVVYPKRHRKLYQQISEQGLIISELEPGTAPLPRFFPGRNRIVSGLSQAVVVAEAAIKSGSLITARLAATQGREVMALPGAVNNPLAAGCHQLIRDGAVLVRDATDVLDELGILELQPPAAADAAEASTSVPALVTQLDYAQVTSLDVLAIRTGKSVSDLLVALMELELEGWLAQEPGGYRRLR